jgi:hypothetical protein
MVPSAKIIPISLCLLIACHTPFAGWSDVSTTLWIFRGSEYCFLLVHEAIKVELGFFTEPQAVLRWQVTAA